MARSAGKKTTSTKKTIVADDRKYLCHHCLKEKKKSDFYVSTDPRVMTGITTICKECVKKIALSWDDNRQEYGLCTKQSVMNALEYIDRPFLNKLWDSSYNEWASQEGNVRRPTIWDAYIKNVAMQQYRGWRWRDGDIFQTYIEDAKRVAALDTGANVPVDLEKKEVNSEFEKNKKDVMRLLGYDPFESENIEDQPLLYSQLIGYLDSGGDGNDDMMRTSSAITIVRGFLQQSKIDDKIARAMLNTNVNPAELKVLLDSKKNLSATISQLAEQSCLSLRYSKNASKGENTWTGKIKKLKELNLREAENNGFDIGTCRGMQQVMDLSNASILKQLNLDESEYSDMLAEQRVMITDLNQKCDSYKEITRILLRENLDLKDLLSENNLLNDENLVDIEELFSPFMETIQDDEEVNEDDGEEV